MFISSEVILIYANLKKQFLSFFRLMNEGKYSDAEEILDDLNIVLKDSVPEENQSEEVLNDLYLLKKYILFSSSYSKLWRLIKHQDYSLSWEVLQDVLDLMRILKKFSVLNEESKHLEFFEEQLINLEKLYPYTVFFSIGAVADYYECSICGNDIDTLDCEHIKGDLYSGVVAYAVCKNLIGLDHVAVVKHPADKRCVMKISDTDEQFTIMQYLSDLLITGKIKPFNFKTLNFTTKKIDNPGHKAKLRNKLCMCGSNKKFKNCCVYLETIDIPHVDIVANSDSVEGSLKYLDSKNNNLILSHEIKHLLK